MYFYLEWTDKRPSYVELFEERPENINFENSFKIKKQEYIICGNINSKFMNYYPPVKLVYKKNQYLLSHLQKCIRRMDDIKSVQTAKHLVDLDCTSFLRRLPIIMLEDVTIHTCFPVIVWLMIAYSKGFSMKHEILKWLLGVVYHLSTCKDKTYYENKEINEIEINTNNRILNSLRFRKAYGGMKGDMNMIEYYTQLVYYDKIKLDEEKIPLVKITMKPLLKKDWIYQANDFHCNRSIIQQINNYFPNYDKEYLKKLIWNFSSSQNNRIYVEKDKKQEEDWEKIKRIVKRVQKSCIYY